MAADSARPRVSAAFNLHAAALVAVDWVSVAFALVGRRILLLHLRLMD